MTEATTTLTRAVATEAKTQGMANLEVLPPRSIVGRHASVYQDMGMRRRYADGSESELRDAIKLAKNGMSMSVSSFEGSFRGNVDQLMASTRQKLIGDGWTLG